MNKKLIAIAVAGLMAAPVAMANVEVYGQARMSVDFSENNDNDNGACGAGNECEDSAISLSSNASRLGFRGTEDLGNGLKAEWQIERGLNFDGTGEGAWSDRNTFVGLSGGFGTVRFGKHDTPNKIASAPLDIFVDTRADFNAIISPADAGSIGDLRPDNTIAYMSPNMGGFQVLAAYVPSYSNDQLPQTTAQSDQDAYSLAGTFSNGPIYVAAAYESLNNFVGNDDLTDTKLAGTFDFGQGTRVGAMYELQDDGDNDRSMFYLNAAHKMGANTFKVAYGMADEADEDDGGSQLAVGVSHDLSKATEVYALYAMLSNDDMAGFKLNGIGGPNGEDQSAFSFGINHRFSSK